MQLFRVPKVACFEGIPLESQQVDNASDVPCSQKNNFWEIYGLYNIKSFNLEGRYAPAMLQQQQPDSELSL